MRVAAHKNALATADRLDCRAKPKQRGGQHASAIAGSPLHGDEAMTPEPGCSVNANQHRRRVLVCDGDLQTVRALRLVLGDAGLEVHGTQTAKDALARAALRVPDVAIIEMSLCDSSGEEVCRRLREWTSMPIIFLSHVSDEHRIVEAFRAGADDYVPKPIRPRELVARIQSRLKRAAADDHEPVIRLHGLDIDLAARVVRQGNRQIRLTPIEYRLLSALARNRGRLLTHDALLRSVWGAAYAEDRQTLRAHMTNLRRKLGSPRSSGPIRTYPGVGYLFEDSAGWASAALVSSTARVLRLDHAAD
jgi:two-component system KDP operon response regulator KdpE